MKITLLIIFAIFLFCGQIAFSIYYSIIIVDENTKINQYQSTIQELNIKNQILQNTLANLNSLKRIKELSQATTLSAIKTTIDLK